MGTRHTDVANLVPASQIAGFEIAIGQRCTKTWPAGRPARLEDFGNDIITGDQVGKGVVSISVRELARLARVELTVAVPVEEDLPVGQRGFAQVADPVAVDVLKLLAANLGSQARGRDPGRSAASGKGGGGADG